MNKSPDAKQTGSRSSWLYRISGTSALITGGIFLFALIRLLIEVLQPDITDGFLSLLRDNWLVVIFKLLAGFSGVQTDFLRILNFLDIAILALAGVTYLGLYAVLKKVSKVWSMIATLLPFLGIILFMATKTAGRSSVMAAGLVISIVMLGSRVFKKTMAYLGILVYVLLLAGDFIVGVIPPSGLVATFFGLGYALLIVWFFLIAQKFLRRQ